MSQYVGCGEAQCPNITVGCGEAQCPKHCSWLWGSSVPQTLQLVVGKLSVPNITVGCGEAQRPKHCSWLWGSSVFQTLQLVVEKLSAPNIEAGCGGPQCLNPALRLVDSVRPYYKGEPRVPNMRPGCTSTCTKEGVLAPKAPGNFRVFHEAQSGHTNTMK